jgi:hypothetical protein
MRSSHDRWPRWVPRTGASSDSRDFGPSTSSGFSQSVGATDHSITFFPRKRHEAASLGLCWGCLPITLPFRHHRPNDARRLVGQSNGDYEAGSPGQQPLDPRIRTGEFGTEQDGLGSDDQQLTAAARPGP